MEIQGSVLVVDDTPDNLRVLNAILTQAGYEPRLLPSGKMALESLQIEQPDIILLDICMPEMDGFEVCEEIKKNPELCDIPVIFISALSDTEDKVKAFRRGGVDYITKPFKEEEVLARIHTHIHLFRVQKELVQKNIELQEALDTVKTLKGLLPICSNCKKIRDDDGYWNQIESYIGEHSEAEFSHSICPDCAQELYPDLDLSEVFGMRKSA